MVVVAIVAIMACVSYSGFSSLLQKEKVTAAANQLMGHLKEAKMLAMEKHQSYTVSLSGNVYTIFRDGDNTANPVILPNYTQEANEPIVHQVNVRSDFGNVTLSANVIPFRFDTRGMPRVSGSFIGTTFTITLAGKRQCTLTVLTTGRIDVTSCQDL